MAKLLIPSDIILSLVSVAGEDKSFEICADYEPSFVIMKVKDGYKFTYSTRDRSKASDTISRTFPTVKQAIAEFITRVL